MAFPVAKLGTLLLRQASKPIANYAKERAKTHPFFRKYVCMPPAQFYNWCEVKMRMWVMNLGKPVTIPQLNEAMAIELGANLLGESIIFGIAALLLFLEYARQVRKEAAKELVRLEEVSNMTTAIKELSLHSARQELQLTELTRKYACLESKVVHRPFAPRSPSESDDPPKPPESDNPPKLPSLEKLKPQSTYSPPRLSEQPSTHSMIASPSRTDRYKGGTILDALDYITYRIPNGYTR